MFDKEPPHFQLHPMRVLFVIGTNPPPTVAHPETASAHLNDFLALCLKKDPQQRASAKQLLRVFSALLTLLC